jgi:hypothetical protein
MAAGPPPSPAISSIFASGIEPRTLKRQSLDEKPSDQIIDLAV